MTRITDQYRIIEAGAGWIDRADRGRLRFEGRDARTFLQALVTNDVAPLGAGEGADAAYLTPQGRMIAMPRLFCRGDDWLVEVAPGQAASLAARFDQLIFTEDVRVADVSAAIAEISVVGGGSAASLERALGVEAARLASLETLGHTTVGDVLIARTDDTPFTAFDLFFPLAARDALIARLSAGGVAAVAAELAEALRIEAGRPLFGVDMTEETIPLEAGLLDRAISTTKGCYVGQEVIIRVLHRGAGRVARRLVRLTFEPDTTNPPTAGTALIVADRETGRMTSAAISPASGRVIALGYVHRDAAVVGARVLARAEAGDRAAVISGLAG
ncbi:MAG: YgfZ/GcvT domain-containing protein [Vicinamibacterales bacterium]